MRPSASICVSIFLASCLGGFTAAQPSSAPAIDSADKLFKTGKFAAARQVYAQVVAHDPKDRSALLQLGYIALLGNQLDDAERWLGKAIGLEPDDGQAKIMMAEVLYRRDEFARAAEVLREIGPNYAGMIQNYSSLNREKLETFPGPPYQILGRGEVTQLKFVKSDPLPVVNVRINGGRRVTFFVDTGGSELLLDSEYAKEMHVRPLGAVQGTFSGDQKAEVENGRVSSVTLGRWIVRNVPVGMLPLRALSQEFGVKQINGCIGTNLLYHFLATIDYPHGELLLRRKTAANLKAVEQAGAGKSVAVPIWMAGDHFMVGWGRVDTNPPSLLFIDTGLAGAAVKLGDAAIKEAQIKLEEDKATTGAGGGGALKTVPYLVKQLAFGDIKEENVTGLYDGPFPWEYRFGFYLSGMVGHDFFKPYAVTLDFEKMRILLEK